MNSKFRMPKVTVYITAFNCDRYVDQAIQSVLKQAYQDWELIIINDASTDFTWDVLQAYRSTPGITLINNKKNIGLIASAKKAIRLAKGKYIMRLDGDDWLDEHALLILTSVLDKNHDIGLVFPDYFTTNEQGAILQHVRQKKIGSEAKLLDLPAHGACTMIRKRCYTSIGGYSRGIKCQDGYDLWIRFVHKYNPYNINLPLFYYRQHGTNLTRDSKKILATRKLIKARFYQRTFKKRAPKILAIIPARSTSTVYPRLPLKAIGGKPLLQYAVSAVLKTKAVQRAVFVSDDTELLQHAKPLGIETLLLPHELTTEQSGIEPVIHHTLTEYKKQHKYAPDIVVVLYLTSPLISEAHINEAIHTLRIFGADSVLSVRENKSLIYRHGVHGLEPLFEKRGLKFERDMLFEETGSLTATKASFVKKKTMLGKKISHILLTEDEAVDINTPFQFWLAEQVILQQNRT